jgi:hypothetical protein
MVVSLCHDGKTASAVTETDSGWVWLAEVKFVVVFLQYFKKKKKV